MNINLNEVYEGNVPTLSEEQIEDYLKTLGFIVNDDSVNEIIKQTKEGETPKMKLFSYKVVDPHS